MNNPHQPPLSDISQPKQKVARIPNPLTALISGMFMVPVVILGGFHILFPDEPLALGNARFWLSLVIGSILSAIGVSPFKRMQLWQAAIIGVVVTVIAIVVPVAKELMFDAT